jgi:hypothetical protein
LPRSWIALTILILAGCSSPPAGTNTALEASPTGLPSQGGTLSLTWKGNSSSYTLAISAPSGTSGVSVNGHPYTQPLQLSATSASVVLPANPTLSAQTYTFTVSAGGRTLSLQAIVEGKPLGSFQATPSSISPQGGQIALTWEGSATSDALTITPLTSGITVNGSPYEGPTTVSGGKATVIFPAIQGPNAVTYTLTLSAGAGVSATLQLLQGTVLAVADFDGAEVKLYQFSGISSSSTPGLTFSTASHPMAVAFDASGNLWVGGGACPNSFLEDFQAPFKVGEQPSIQLTPAGLVLSLAVDASGNLWAGELISCGTDLIQEYTVGSSGLTATTQLHPPGEPDGLAFDASGNLWVGLSSNQGTEFLEYTSPISGTSTPSSYSLTGPYGFGPLAFDTQGNLYSFEENNPAPLEELLAGSSATSPNFTTLFQVNTAYAGYPPNYGLAFDAQGHLWVTDTSGIQEFSSLSANAQPVLTLSDSSNPTGLAFWPVPPGLPLH